MGKRRWLAAAAVCVRGGSDTEGAILSGDPGHPTRKQRPHVVLVTGASSGIGKACTERLAAHGFSVFGTSRSAPSGGSVRGAEGAGWTWLPMDVDDGGSVEETVGEVLRRAGRIDALVNSAGFGIGGPIEETPIEAAKALFETNVFGVLRVCRAVLPAMRRERGGTIINVSSLAGRIGLPFQGLYAATKFAVEGLSESLRMEVRPFGIRVVLVEPGDIRTEFTARRHRVSASDAYRERSDRALARAEADEQGGASPDAVARRVLSVIRARSPRLRYTVGALGQRVPVLLRPFLPGRLFESGMMTYYDAR